MEKADEDKKDTQETERKRREGRIDKKRANDRDRGISEEKIFEIVGSDNSFLLFTRYLVISPTTTIPRSTN